MSGLLRRAAMLACTVAVLAQPIAARAQGTGDANEPWAITDNSFFVEEAFNQERGIFQNIFVWEKVRNGGWDGSFTQEWPAPSMRHQLSYTIPFDGGVIGTHVGGVLLNYRFQAVMEGPGRPAFSPRVSLILPTGRADDAGDRPGVQINLPFSKQLGNLYAHANAGLTYLQGVPLGSQSTGLTSPHIAGSVIWRAKSMFNLMIEGGIEFAESADGLSTSRQTSVLVSPGFRGGWNFGDKQVVLGVALPITTAEGDTTVAVLSYLSYELPFSGDR